MAHWNKDGTQDPGPPPVLADPLAGLVTGSRYEPEPLKVRVVEQPMPDITAVREAMAAVLDEDSEFTFGSIAPAPEPDENDPPPSEIPAQAGPPDVESTPTPPPSEPVAQVPAPPVPAPTPPAAPPAPRTVPGAAAASVPARFLPEGETSAAEDTRRIRVPRGLVGRRHLQKPPPGTEGTSSTGGVALIMAFLVVIGVIVIVFLVSLINTIASVFD